MTVATAAMAWFAWEANQQTRATISQTALAMQADNRPDLLITYLKHEVATSHGGFRVINTGKGPAILVSMYLLDGGHLWERGLNDTYVPVGSEPVFPDDRMAGGIQEMINLAHKETPSWEYEGKHALFLSLEYKDILDNLYQQDFLYQPPNNPVPIWQKGCRFLGTATARGLSRPQPKATDQDGETDSQRPAP